MAMRKHGARSVLAGLALATAASAFGGCASSKPPRPPFPTDDDPCAAYCLVWVPPTYRDVPCLVQRDDGGARWRDVCVEKTVYREVEKPAEYVQRDIPDECRAYGIVQTTPAREEWVCVKCRDCTSDCNEDCWKKVRIPPQYEWCQKHETKDGWSYCAFTPPEYGIVAETVTCTEKRCDYVPPSYEVAHKREVYEPGHWEWQKKYCAEEPAKCLKAVCAPCDSCPPASKGRASFANCPGKD